MVLDKTCCVDQFIDSYLRNQVPTNKSWFTVYKHIVLWIKILVSQTLIGVVDLCMYSDKIEEKISCKGISSNGNRDVVYPYLDIIVDPDIPYSNITMFYW